MQMIHVHSFHAYLSRRHLQQSTHGRRGALRSPSRRYNTALHTNSPKHFHKILTKENLEFLDPFASQTLVASSVFTLLLNPNWFVLALAASGS